MTTIYLRTTIGRLTGRFQVRAETEAGQLVGQSLHADEAEAVQLAKFQAYRWCSDRGLGKPSFCNWPSHRRPAREVRAPATR